jgi:purine-binding chemotaxis protein CheW
MSQSNYSNDEDDIYYDEEDVLNDKFLTFHLENEIFALDITKVIEIIGVQPITLVPEAPKYLKGIINLRGNLIPVIDLRVLFKMDEKEFRDRTCFIVLNFENNFYSLVVDEVADVISIEKSEINYDFSEFFSKFTSYIYGIARQKEKVITILDVSKLYFK